MKRIEIILPVALILLSCGDGRKTSSESKGETTEFEVVGKKEKPSEDTVDEPVSVSSILSGKEPVGKDGGDDVVSGQFEDPLGGDESYLEGDGYDY